ncbi:MAG: type I phosphomannose isomerase catalytic subunit [Erysipelotrichaceae bacterium]
MSIIMLNPSYKDYLWGGQNLIHQFNKEFSGDILAESWEVSCHPDGPSFVATGECAGMTLREYIEHHGNSILGTHCEKFDDFPILIKFIDAKGVLSIQVHPDNEYALKNENQYGKTEVWYVVDCEPGAFLYYGFSKEISKEEFKQRIENNTLLEVLGKFPVQKGEIYFIEAGTIHAIGENITIAEIQQNSNVTYRVYDFGRVGVDGKPRELHIDRAIDVTSRTPLFKSKTATPHLAKCDYFTVDKLFLDGTSMKKIVGSTDETSFASILILEGSGTLSSNGETIDFKKGDSLFVTANHGEYQLEGNFEGLLTRI